MHRHQTLAIANGVAGATAIAPLYRAGIDLIQGPYVQAPAETMAFDFAQALG
ncbi:hypothetical protein [uncultured Thiodictyon sp.]|uniref:hypothetical protein n=1 Tax=uncultured Thiodictyon sp. TaxID=1846217 RepID=UPI0025EE2E70|nr:hypothetical protein [uncultured Thiodictyon sp.]